MKYNNEQISILDILLIIAKKWKFIFFTTLFVSLSVLILMIISKKLDREKSFLPDQYTSSAIIYFNESGSSGLGSMFGGGDKSLLSLTGLGLSGKNKPSDILQPLLFSNNLIDKIVKNSSRDFIEFYAIKNTIKNSTRKIVKKNFSIIKDKLNPSIIIITYKDIYPEFAFETLNNAVNYLQQEYNRLAVEKGNEKLFFFQDRLRKAENEFNEATSRFNEFCRSNNIVNLEAQLQNQFSQVAALNARLLEKEVELKEIKNFRGENDPIVQQKIREINSIKDLIKQFDKGFTEFSVSKSIPTDKIPKISAQYANNKMEVEIKQQILLLVRQQFESSRLEVDNDFSNFQLIQTPEVPEEKSGPARSKILILVTFATGFFLTFLVFLMEFTKQLADNPEEADKISKFKSYLRLRKRR